MCAACNCIRIRKLMPPLDWFHVTLRMTVLKQIARALPGKVGEGEDR